MPKAKTNSANGLIKVGKLKFDKSLLSIVAIVVVATGGYLFYKGSHASGVPCVRQTFSQGSSGQCVKDIQTLSNFKSIVSPKLTVDGSFGPKTRIGVTQVQLASGYSIDGIVGPKTWGALCAHWVNPRLGVFFTGVYKTAYLNAGCTLIVPGQ